jgi:hypothetical protein
MGALGRVVALTRQEVGLRHVASFALGALPGELKVAVGVGNHGHWRAVGVGPGQLAAVGVRGAVILEVNSQVRHMRIISTEVCEASLSNVKGRACSISVVAPVERDSAP